MREFLAYLRHYAQTQIDQNEEQILSYSAILGEADVLRGWCRPDDWIDSLSNVELLLRYAEWQDEVANRGK